jgi:2-dehydropantoate 2-reductase
MAEAGAAMRVLVIGAGALGGYFGGRLLAAGRDTTFLVRPGRAAQLARDGLVIKSRHGDLKLAAPPHVLAKDLRGPYDLILLSCKAYDLDAAMADFAPAVGPQTAILPLLNGMLHLDALDARFGAEHVLGGQSVIGATLDADGTIIHLNDLHLIGFGERDGTRSARVAAIAALMQDAGFASQASETILRDMWEKFVFLASVAGMTSVMRAPVGDIVAAGGSDLAVMLAESCRRVAVAAGYPPRDEHFNFVKTVLTTPGSPATASMMRDIERGGAIEAEHIIGDMLRRHDALAGADGTLLRTVYVHLKAYEARRARERAQ